MKRFGILGVLCMFLMWPLGVGAQQSSLPVVGILSGTDRDERNVEAILLGLRQSGFEEGGDVTVEYGLAQGQFDRLPTLADDMVRRGVCAIVAIQSANAPRAAQALGAELFQNAGSEQDRDAAFAPFVERKVGAVTFAADAVYNQRPS